MASIHASSMENMQRCFDRHVSLGDRAQGSEPLRVLELRGAGQGTYRTIFADSAISYALADAAEGPGVDLVMSDPHAVPLADGVVDVVVCGQFLERCAYFWLAFRDMVRVLKPGGRIFLVASSTGPSRPEGAACYRFLPEGFRALAKYAHCTIDELWQDERGPWNDLVGVFSKPASPAWPGKTARQARPVRADDPSVSRGSDEQEATAGSMHYRDVLRDIHASLKPRFYLEVGVRTGSSLRLSSCPAVGIDPEPKIAQALPPSIDVVEATSDAYFREPRAPFPAPLDFAFIDGMHHFEFALRDFMNIERLCHPASVIAIDDILPNNLAQAQRTRETRSWAGDIWKLKEILVRLRPDLTMLTLDAAPTGILIVAGLNPASRVLWKNYNALVKRYAHAGVAPGQEVLDRTGAWPPNRPEIHQGLAALSRLRGDRATAASVKRTLKAWAPDPPPVGGTAASPPHA